MSVTLGFNLFVNRPQISDEFITICDSVVTCVSHCPAREAERRLYLLSHGLLKELFITTDSSI